MPRDELGAATPEYQEEALTKLLADQTAHEIPEQFDPVILAAFVPKDNATTPERVALGRKLYFDKRLSQRRHRLLRHLPRRDPRASPTSGRSPRGSAGSSASGTRRRR